MSFPLVVVSLCSDCDKMFFTAPCLPRGGAKTFRFSYVTKQGDTIGISSPFHFSAPDASLECSETISDIVVIEREMESSEVNSKS